MKKGGAGGVTGGFCREDLLPLIFALVSLAVVVWVRVRLLQTPLERDEGEYAYAGQLILKGFPPYQHAFSMKLPGMFYLNAAMLKIFGGGVSAIRLGLLVANLVSALLIHLIAVRLFNRGCGFVAASIFVLMTVSQHLLGIFAHATHFVDLFVLCAFSLIIAGQKSVSPYRYLSAGIFFGLAFLVKQHAAFFLLAAIMFVLLESSPLPQAAGNIVTMMSGFAIPPLLTALVVFLKGTFAPFWLWTVKYAKSYATGLPPIWGWINFRSQMGDILGSMAIYWLLAGAGLLLVTFGSSRIARNFLLPLLVCSFLAMCPGFHFRPHYFILMAPVVALLAAAPFAVKPLPRWLRGGLFLVLAGAVLFQFWAEGWFLFAATPEEYVKRAYKETKPFAESVAVARYVREKTGKKDRILVLGSEPQIYFYADRLSATGHIYMYPFMEDHPYTDAMRAEMARDMTASRPRYVVVVDDLSSWMAVTPDCEAFRGRLEDLVARGYELDGVAAVSREGRSYYAFGATTRQFVPGSGSRILVYKLKSEGNS